MHSHKIVSCERTLKSLKGPFTSSINDKYFGEKCVETETWLSHCLSYIAPKSVDAVEVIVNRTWKQKIQCA